MVCLETVDNRVRDNRVRVTIISEKVHSERKRKYTVRNSSEGENTQ